jgi:hypothetical protein
VLDSGSWRLLACSRDSEYNTYSQGQRNLRNISVGKETIIGSVLVACDTVTRSEFLTHQARRDTQLGSAPRRVLRIEMSDGFASPRVNAARIKSYLGAGHPVRVTGKVLNVRDDNRSTRVLFPITATCCLSVFRR